VGSFAETLVIVVVIKVIDMVTQQEFSRFYETHLKPKLVQLDVQRRSFAKKYKWLNIFSWSMIILFCLLYVVMGIWFDNYYQGSKDFGFVLAMIPVLGLLAAIIVYSHYEHKWKLPYQNRFKTEIVKSIVTLIDKNLSYYPKRQITRQELTASLLENYLPWWWTQIDSWAGDDYFEGTVGNIFIKFSEIYAESTYDFGSDTLFKGLFFIFDLNKVFDGFLVILPNPKTGKNPYRKYGTLIKLAEPEFEREFIVYSNNEMRAIQVLTPSFISNLVKFRRQLGKNISLSLVNNQLYVLISIDKNLFEPTIYSTLLDFNLYRHFFENIQLGKEIVENLNMNTWDKTETSGSVLTSNHLKNMINHSNG